jgi:hypothetical protein
VLASEPAPHAHQARQTVLVPAGVIARTIRDGDRDVVIDRLLKRPLVEVPALIASSDESDLGRLAFEHRDARILAV